MLPFVLSEVKGQAKCGVVMENSATAFVLLQIQQMAYLC
jgi:hypothetical protein